MGEHVRGRLTLLAGAAGAVVTIYDRGNLADVATENTASSPCFQVGWGLNLAIGASIVLGVVGLVALLHGLNAARDHRAYGKEWLPARTLPKPSRLLDRRDRWRHLAARRPPQPRCPHRRGVPPGQGKRACGTRADDDPERREPRARNRRRLPWLRHHRAQSAAAGSMEDSLGIAIVVAVILLIVASTLDEGSPARVRGTLPAGNNGARERLLRVGAIRGRSTTSTRSAVRLPRRSHHSWRERNASPNSRS